jgi:dihydroorotate dehydrogenase electron transfer subunit
MNAPTVALVEGTVALQREVGPELYLLRIRAPGSFPTPEPGQFIMVKASLCPVPLLARPFSVTAFDRLHDHVMVDIIYRLAGQGTRLLAGLAPGAPVSLRGPLGRGFTIIPERKNVVLIAGGIGIAPLAFLAEQYVKLIRKSAERRDQGLHRRVIVYAGAGTAKALTVVERLETFCEEIKVSTDDGSAGFRGTVVSLFRRDAAFYHPDDTVIYACGPSIMLKELSALFQGTDIFYEVSTEERMACGIGACLGCVLPVNDRAAEMHYRRVCTDGPVFPGTAVIWGE